LRLFVVGIEVRHDFELCADEDQRQHCGNKVRDRCGVHRAVDAEEDRQNDQQRQQEDDLSGQGQEHAAFRHTHCGEEVGRDRLQEVDTDKEHINTEVTLRESEVFFCAAAEEADDLAREELEAEESHNGDSGRRFAGEKDGILHALEVARAEVEGNDRLHTLTDTDNHGEEDHADLGNDTAAGQRDLTAVNGQRTVVGHGVVEHHLHHHHRTLVEERSQAQRKNRQAVCFAEAEVAQSQFEGLEARQIEEHHHTGHELSQYSRPSRTGHAPVKDEDEQRVQDGIDDGAHQVAHHGILRAAVTADEVGTAGGQNQEGEAEGGDAGVGHGVRHDVGGRTEDGQHRLQKSSGNNAEHDTQSQQHGEGRTHVAAGFFRLFSAHGDVEVCRTANAAKQSESGGSGGQREGNVGGGVTQHTDAVADEELVHHVVQSTDQHSDDAWHRKLPQQSADFFRTQRILFYLVHIGTPFQ